MQEHFHALADEATATLCAGENFTMYLSGESSEFCRLNHGKVRQAGSVTQAQLNLRLIARERSAAMTLSVARDPTEDAARVCAAIAELRTQIDALPADPFLLYATEPHSTEARADNALPAGTDIVARITAAAADLDLVGILAAGPVFRGFANSFGQRNWHELASFNFDFSVYLREDKAVKKTLAGTHWDDEAFGRQLSAARTELDALARPARTIAPGRYRVYLAPAALKELLDLLAWDSFSIRAHRTKQTSLLQMVECQQRLSASVTLREDSAAGLAPNFNSAGFIKPETVTLIERGAYRDCLVSPRSAREYGVPTNAASDRESPESLALAGGSLASADIARALGDGLWINNLWYLNYSDRNACRVTGMTRFACFVVERGELRAPLNVMRFDDSVLRMLGPQLEGLTSESEWIASADSYGERSTDSLRLPGALIDGVALTL
jgi:predicted Zn-dependent protease